MIHTDATGITWPVYTGGPDVPATDDVMRFARAADPLVLEAQVNALGVAEASIPAPEPGPRYLAGMQLGGAGKGYQFMVTMLFTRTGMPAENIWAVEAGPGLRAFFYQGETPEALERNKNLALARAVAFVGEFEHPEYRGFEVAGSNDGLVYMGMFLVNRITRQG
jgi:hypothetical protein